MLELLDTPGCSARRNCKVNLDDLRWDRPHVDCEPQQARGIPRNLQLDETGAAAVGGEMGTSAVEVGKVVGFGCGIRGLGGLSAWLWRVVQQRRQRDRLRGRRRSRRNKRWRRGRGPTWMT